MIARSLFFLLLAGGAVSQYTCGNGWLQYEDTCVLPIALSLSYYLAQEYCFNQHADLLIIRDQQMQEWIVEQMAPYGWPFWIGLNDRQDNGLFEWVDGTPLAGGYSNWAPGQPSHNNVQPGEDCVEMYNDGQWNDDQCYQFYYFFCSKPIDQIPKCDIENFWEPYGGKCYRWVLDMLSYEDATTYCTTMDGYIISINDGDEQSFAYRMQSRHLNLPYWVGLSDEGQTQGNYVWQDGTSPSSYDNWDVGQPDSSTYPGCTLTEQSVQGEGNWTVTDCNGDYMFICEKPEGACAEGWTLHGGQCYQWNTLLRTWFDAKYYCDAQGGWLATVSSGSENSFIASNMQPLADENIPSMWIGLSDTANDGVFEWVHQTVSVYDHWAPGKPVNTYGVPDCAFMNTADLNGTWYQEQCTLLGGFVCQIEPGSIVTPVDPVKVGSCEPGWSLYDDSCFFSPAKTLDWDSALTECRGLFPGQSDLASIRSYEEQSFVTERMKAINDETWIGLSDKATEGVFVWSDGTVYNPGYFSNWAPGEPNNLSGEDCVHLENYFYKVGFWNDHKCSSIFRFLCKMPKYNTPPATYIPPPTLPPADRCGSGWIYDTAGQNCYKFVKNARMWTVAEEDCHVEGGHLASILSPSEQDFVQRNAIIFHLNDGIVNFWIGLHDTNVEGGFVWSDGAPLAYLNWNGGEPNDVNDGEDCAEMYSDSGVWNDMPCESEYSYICKRNGLITQQFTAYPNAQLQTSDSGTPIANMWPEDCAFSCYAYGQYCRSFHYHRSSRECTLFGVDQDSSSASLIPAFEDPWDYYERDFSGPPYYPPTTIAPSYGCQQGEYGYRGYCYTLVTSMSDFDGMQLTCAQQGGDLVSVADNAEMNYVISLMQTGNQGTNIIAEVWLGLTDRDKEAWYGWTDGSPVTYTKWAMGEPTATDDEDCVVHNYAMQGWRGVPCSGSSAYGVCKKSKTSIGIVPPSNDGCPDGWVKYMSSCYQFVKGNKLTWAVARDTCQQRGGRLTTITSNYEQAYLASQMGGIVDYTGDYWIGLSDTENPGTYMWVDGTYPTIAAWGPGQPDDTRFGQCVALIGGVDTTHAGKWMSEDCLREHNYICEQPIEGATDTPYTMPPVTQPSNEGCDDEGAIGYGDYCFIVFEEAFLEDRYSWQDARTQCQLIGADLASFHSKEEEMYVVDQFVPLDPDELSYGYWLGMNDMSTESGWQWSDGTAVMYVNWNDGEPNDGGGNEDCGEMFMNEGRGWNDIPCYVSRNWVCKRRKFFQQLPSLPPVGICPSDPTWQYVAPYCYYHSSVVGEENRLGWDAAEDFCHQKGGHLVSIESETENRLIVEMSPVVATEYWIGLRQYTREGPYEWSDGTPYTFSMWRDGQPDNENGKEMCAQMWRYIRNDGLTPGGIWSDAPCGVEWPFICKRRDDSIDPVTHTPTDPPYGGCSNGYFKYFNKCFRMGGYEEYDRYNWADANDLCISEGGFLASIHSAKVQALLTSMLIDLPLDAWIGFTDLGGGNKGQYHWVDGSSATFTNWYPGEPSDTLTFPGVPPKDCVELLNAQWYAGLWNDAACDPELGYVCAKDLEPGQSEDPPPNTFCADNRYYSYGDSCFRLDPVSRSYSDAQALCAADGGQLASITDSYYEAFVEYIMYLNGVTDAWLGMTSDSDGQFTWSDGWPVHFSKWGENEPTMTPSEGCVIITDAPAWEDRSCSEMHATLCRTTSAQPPPPVEHTDGVCPPDFSAWGDSCYYVPGSYIHADWSSSRSDCQKMGADLASIHSKSENEFVRGLVFGIAGVRTAWIGLERYSTGGFLWTDMTPVDYVHWANGEPTDEYFGKYENCVEMYANEYGTWNDEDCIEGGTYICKMLKINNDTQSQPVSGGGGGMSGGAIAGIVIGTLVIVLAVLLLIGWSMNSRKSSPSLPTTTTPTGFDNAVYSANEPKPSVEQKKETLP